MRLFSDFVFLFRVYAPHATASRAALSVFGFAEWQLNGVVCMFLRKLTEMAEKRVVLSEWRFPNVGDGPFYSCRG